MPTPAELVRADIEACIQSEKGAAPSLTSIVIDNLATIRKARQKGVSWDTLQETLQRHYSISINIGSLRTMYSSNRDLGAETPPTPTPRPQTIRSKAKMVNRRGDSGSSSGSGTEPTPPDDNDI